MEAEKVIDPAAYHAAYRMTPSMTGKFGAVIGKTWEASRSSAPRFVLVGGSLMLQVSLF